MPGFRDFDPLSVKFWKIFQIWRTVCLGLPVYLVSALTVSLQIASIYCIYYSTKLVVKQCSLFDYSGFHSSYTVACGEKELPCSLAYSLNLSVPQHFYIIYFHSIEVNYLKKSINLKKKKRLWIHMYTNINVYVWAFFFSWWYKEFNHFEALYWKLVWCP